MSLSFQRPIKSIVIMKEKKLAKKEIILRNVILIASCIAFLAFGRMENYILMLVSMGGIIYGTH